MTMTATSIRRPAKLAVMPTENMSETITHAVNTIDSKLPEDRRDDSFCTCGFPQLETGECVNCGFRTELDFLRRYTAGEPVSVILTGARVSPQLIEGKWYWTLDCNFGDHTEFDGNSVLINTTANSLERLLSLPEGGCPKRLQNALKRFDDGEEITHHDLCG